MKDDVWNFKTAMGEIIVTPRIEQMQEYINDRAHDLSLRLESMEELLIIQGCTDDTLKKLRTICDEELKRRKKDPVKA